MLFSNEQIPDSASVVGTISIAVLVAVSSADFAPYSHAFGGVELCLSVDLLRPNGEKGLEL